MTAGVESKTGVPWISKVATTDRAPLVGGRLLSDGMAKRARVNCRADSFNWDIPTVSSVLREEECHTGGQFGCDLVSCADRSLYLWQLVMNSSNDSRFCGFVESQRILDDRQQSAIWHTMHAPHITQDACPHHRVELVLTDRVETNLGHDVLHHCRHKWPKMDLTQKASSVKPDPTERIIKHVMPSPSDDRYGLEAKSRLEVSVRYIVWGGFVSNEDERVNRVRTELHERLQS